MKGFIILIGILGLIGCRATDPAVTDCVLQKVSVASTDTVRNEFYAARAGTVDVQFRNENAPTPADAFPDPLVTVKNLATTKYCEITDGSGIWSGKFVYLDAHERILVLNEYSGSNDTLVFYDPKTCRRIATLDVSNRRWEISGDRIRTGQHCGGDDVNSCRDVHEVALDRQCLVKN